MDTARAIQILGVNDQGLEVGNEGIIEGRSLPWLQPGADEDIWTLWNVEYRDVFIVGPGNEHVGTFNLTVHDLADAASYAALREELLKAAAND